MVPNPSHKAGFWNVLGDVVQMIIANSTESNQCLKKASLTKVGWLPAYLETILVIYTVVLKELDWLGINSYMIELHLF